MQTEALHLRVAVTSLGMAVLIGLMPANIEAQQRQLDRILILTPQPEDPQDSTYVREMTEFLRTRVQNKFRHKWTVIGTDVIEDLLVSSGFAANTIIEPAMVDQVARSLQARGYMYGVLKRQEATPLAVYRMVDVSRSGLSGWVTVHGQPGDPPRSFADRVADSLDNQVRAADFAKECNARRDRSDFNRARQSAGRAYELYPNHPSSSICLSYVFQATQQPADSVIWVYEKATRGDSLLISAWEDLAAEYQRAGDTLNAVGAFARLLAADPTDEQIRFSVAAGYMATHQTTEARAVIEEGLRRNPENLRFARLLQTACLEGQDWRCALEASERLYELDSTLVGNVEFYNGVFSLVQELGDSAAWLGWSNEAVTAVPTSIPFWQARAVLLEAMFGPDSALIAYQRLIELDSTDVRSTIKVLQAVGESFVVDTLSPVDTATMTRIDELARKVISMSGGNGQLITVAGAEYLKAGTKLIQTQVDIELGIQWIERAMEHDPGDVFLNQSNFWLGYGLFFIATAMDGQIVESQSCAAIAGYDRVVRRGRQALTAGRSVSPETADQLLPVYEQLSARPQQFREAFKCN